MKGTYNIHKSSIYLSGDGEGVQNMRACNYNN